MVWFVIALAIFIVVNVLFYSSFFTNYPQGVYDSLKTFQFWTKTGKEAHVHPFATYFWWLLLQESPLLVLGTIGAALAVLKPTKSFALFAALWAFGLIAAYSLIAYKTPWLSLSFIVPLALTSGAAIQWLYEDLGKFEISRRFRWYALAAVLLIALGPLPGLARIFDQVVAPNPWPGLVQGSQSDGDALEDFHSRLSNDRSEFHQLRQRRSILRLCLCAHAPGDFEAGRRNRPVGPAYASGRRDRHHDGFARLLALTVVSARLQASRLLRPHELLRLNRSLLPGRIRRRKCRPLSATVIRQIQSGFNPAGSFPLRPGVDLLLYARRELVH